MVKAYPFPVIYIRRSVLKPLHYFRYFRAARKHGAKADVIYAQDPVSSGYPASLAARSLKKPFVLRVPGDYSWEQAYGRKLTDLSIDDFQLLRSFPRPIARIRGLQISACRSADVIVTPSEYLKRLVVGWGIKESKPQVIYNSIPALPDIGRDQARQELGFADDDFVVFSAGRSVPWKGFSLLREVVSDLSKKDSRYRLVIQNDAPRSDILKNLRACDVFILNSGYEGFAFILLEAAAMGAPIVTTTSGANPEVISEGKNGLLITYNDRSELEAAIEKLRNDPGLRMRLADEAKKLLGVFAEERMINETEGVLLKCAS